MRMLIVGAGKTGLFLAERLHKEHEITVIDSRADRIELLRARVPEAGFVLGDACEPDVLETAGIEECDLVVAVTGDDEDNLVVAMLAKVYRSERVYARVNHPNNEWLFDKEWGVDVAISNPAVLLGLVEKDLGMGDLITLLRLQADGVSVEEMTLPEDARSVGRKLSEVPLPSNVTVMAILARGGYVQAARGDTLLVAGDQLLLLVEGELTEGRIREAFGVPVEESPGSGLGAQTGH